MLGIVLAGGTGSRLWPLTVATNKHLLPLADKPMIYYPVYRLVEAGINSILITSTSDGIGKIIQSLNVLFPETEFIGSVQDKPDGIAGALKLASPFVRNENCTVILGDNIFCKSIKKYVDSFNKIQSGPKALVLLKKVDNPSQFGIANIKNFTIESIIEKPKKPKSNLAVTGCYMYDSYVFDFIKEINPSKRQELEITDINNMYIEHNGLFYGEINGNWFDAGTLKDLYKSNIYLQKKKFI